MKRALASLTAVLQSLLAHCQAHPRVAVALTLAAVIAMGSQLPRLRSELQVYDINDPTFPSINALREMKDSFGDAHSIILVFHNKKGGAAPLTNAQLCAVRDFIHREQLANDDLAGVVSPFDLRLPRVEGDKLWYHRILTPDCAPGAASATLSALVNSPWAGILTDKPGRDLMVEFRFRDTEGSGRFGRFDPAPIGALLAKARELTAATPDLAFVLNGAASFQWHFKELLARDALLNPLLIVIFMLFFRVFYGTWRAGVFFTVTLALTAALVYGAMALAGTPIDLLTSNLFIITAIAGTEDFLFLSHRVAAGDEPWDQSFRRLLMPSFFTSVTTAVGFGSLCVSELQVIQRFGFWCAVAAMAEFFMTLYFLPALCALFGSRGCWVDPARSWRPAVFSRLEGVSFGRGATRLSVALLAGGAFGFLNLNYDASPRGNFMPNHDHSRSYRYLSDTRGWEGLVWVVFPQMPPDEASKSRIAGILAKVAEDPNVALIDEPYGVLEWARRAVPAGFGDLVARDMASSEGFEGYLSRDRQARAAVYLRSMDISAVDRTVARIRVACPLGECFPAGESVVYGEYTKKISQTLTESFLVSIGLVTATLFFLAMALLPRGGAATALRLACSTAWCPLVMIGAMALLRVPVNLVTCLFAAVLVGLAGDNAVQYLFAGTRSAGLGQGISDCAGATVQLGIVLSAASLVLLGLTLVPMKILGALFFCGFLLTLAGDLWLLRGLLPPARPASG